jgi:hypothetical protein
VRSVDIEVRKRQDQVVHECYTMTALNHMGIRGGSYKDIDRRERIEGRDSVERTKITRREKVHANSKRTDPKLREIVRRNSHK